jgi:hypothetical protein
MQFYLKGRALDKWLPLSCLGQIIQLVSLRLQVSLQASISIFSFFTSSSTTMIFISKVFVQVVFFALLVSSVISAPIVKERSVKERSPDSDAFQLSTRNIHMKTAVKIARKIKSSLMPLPGKSVFYTGMQLGKHKLIPVKQHAEHFAKDNGLELLGPVLARAKVRIPTPEKNPYSSRLWEFASKAYAMRAEGVAHAIVGSTVSKPGGVYHRIEKPTLLKNPKVEKLIEHNVHTGEITVVKKL